MLEFLRSGRLAVVRASICADERAFLGMDISGGAKGALAFATAGLFKRGAWLFVVGSCAADITFLVSYPFCLIGRRDFGKDDQATRYVPLVLLAAGSSGVKRIISCIVFLEEPAGGCLG